MISLGLDPDTTHVGFGILASNVGEALFDLHHPVLAGLIDVCDDKAAVEDRIQSLALIVPQVFASLATKFQPNIIVIESQRYRTHSKVDAQDLIMLAQAAGICMAAARCVWPRAGMFTPEPADWKGSIPKEVFTRRLISRMKLGQGPTIRRRCAITYNGAEISERLPASKHTHAIDALGLARWGLTARV